VTDQEPAIRTLSSRVVYRNQYLSLREDEIQRADGSLGIYSVVDKPDFALVIPLQDNGFHLVEQYRYTVGIRCWEFPQGSFPDGVTGTPEELAARELAEETGLRAGTLTPIGMLHIANGTTGQAVHNFLATDLTQGEAHLEIEEQDLRPAWFPRAEVAGMIADGVITDAATVAAYLLLTMREG
jgi:8-oxo-dGDP phosphatase